MLDIKKINKLEFYDIGVFILLIKTVLSHSDLIPIDNWLDDVLSIVSELGTTDYMLPMMRCLHEEDAVNIDINDTMNKYYLSINAKNNKGVIGTIGRICAENEISLASIVQRGVDDDNTANITVITELALEKSLQKAVREFEEDEYINKVNSLIRVQV